MFVVRRNFRNIGVVMLAGSVITDTASIKHFKSLKKDGHIIEVTEHTLDKFESFFSERFGVSIKDQLASMPDPYKEPDPDKEPDKEPKPDKEPELDKKPVVATVTTKVTSK